SATDCVRVNASKFSKTCLDELVATTWNQEEAFDKCKSQFEKYCGADNDDPDCLMKNKDKISPDCKLDEGNLGGDKYGKALDACQKDLEKNCTLDEALLDKDPAKATKKY